MTRLSTGETFAEQGYYLARQVFSLNELKSLEVAFDQVVHQLESSEDNVNARWQGQQMDHLDGGQSVITHTHNIQSFSAQWAAALFHPPFLDVAEQILGPDIILHHTKLFCKPPGNGAPFPMHQDWSYFPTENDSMIAAIIHVSEATEEMGCLRVFPGSHKHGHLKGMKGQGSTSQDNPEFPIDRATPVEAEPGDVLFFHYCLVHGSLQNLSSRHRKTVLVQMYAGNDAVFADNRHSNVQLVLRGQNHRMSRAAASKLR